jgi:hypothetical protein
MTISEFRKLTMAELRTRGYRNVGVDHEGRIVVEVDEEKHSDHELFRLVWGPEWQVVRSAAPVIDPKFPMEAQFQFGSRGY